MKKKRRKTRGISLPKLKSLISFYEDMLKYGHISEDGAAVDRLKMLKYMYYAKKSLRGKVENFKAKYEMFSKN